MLESESGADSRTPARLFALKQGDTFVVADACGNITGEGDGLFHDDTRLLSQFRLSCRRPAARAAGRRSGRGQCRLHGQPDQQAPAAHRRPVDQAGRDPRRALKADLGGPAVRTVAPAQLRSERGTPAAAVGVCRRFPRYVRGSRAQPRDARSYPRRCRGRGFDRAELRGARRSATGIDHRLRRNTRLTWRPASPTSSFRSRPDCGPTSFTRLGWGRPRPPRGSAFARRRPKLAWRRGPRAVVAPGWRPADGCSASG